MFESKPSIKERIRYRLPEIIIALNALMAFACLIVTMKKSNFKIAITPDETEHILVLVETQHIDAYRDLDTGDLYHVSPF